MSHSHESPVLYNVRDADEGRLLVEVTDEGMLRRLKAAASTEPTLSSPHDRAFFLATREPDGRYRVSMTEEGVQKLETALGIADDFGRHRSISSQSTIADIMDRTATREELGEVMQTGPSSGLLAIRRAVLTAKYRGSEEPSTELKTISHVFKAILVGLVGLWTIRQFGVAFGDIQDIPGIVAGIPVDLIHLDPGHAPGEVSARIDDATTHFVWGVEGSLATYIAAKIVRPFARIYRKDQLVTGCRFVLGAASRLLGRITRRT